MSTSNEPTDSPAGQELADKATNMQGNPVEDDELAEAIAKLSPEEADMFVRALEMTMKRRRLLLRGYLAALVTLIAGMVLALYVYGSREPGTFVGWVFLIPFAGVGIILSVFGHLAKSSNGVEPAPAKGSTTEAAPLRE